MIRRPALFVGHKNGLANSGGGVQLCNRYYVTLLEAAGFDLRKIAYEFTSGLKDKLIGRLVPSIANAPEPNNLFKDLSNAAEETSAEVVFFVMNVYSTLSTKVKMTFPQAKQVLLSHGTEVIDFCIDQRLRRESKTENRMRFVAERMIGRSFFDEFERRRCIDAVLTLSPFEAELEKWLGARKVLWVPTTIIEPPLEVRPVDQRVGCVLTLDHPPNITGLVELLEALKKVVSASFRFRIVGQPRSIGEMLAGRFGFVEFLGPLPDADLRLEAATWCCFINPIFVYAKGCSTKIAVALGWGLPLATTAFGARGYVWNNDLIPVAETPAQLAALVLERSGIGRFEAFRGRTKAVAEITPSVQDMALKVRAFL